MQIIKQQHSLPVGDLVSHLFSTSSEQRHGSLFPSSIRCLIAGPSGCGKTNLLLTLITSLNGVRFQNIYIFAKSLYQPLYVFLEQVMSGLRNMGYFTFAAHEDVISPDNVRPHSLMIFDDVATERQGIIQAYFSMGRHKYIDCFYLAQTYSRIPKQLIRDNANVIVLFRQDERNMHHVYDDHVNPDMTFQAFTQLCAMCWNAHHHSCLVIDKQSNINNGRYRMGFDHFIRI